MKLKNGAWKTMSQNARDKTKGVFEGKHIAKKVCMITHSRQTAISAHIFWILLMLTSISPLTGAPLVLLTLSSKAKSFHGCLIPSVSVLHHRTWRTLAGALFTSQPGETKWSVGAGASEANLLRCYLGLRDLRCIGSKGVAVPPGYFSHGERGCIFQGKCSAQGAGEKSRISPLVVQLAVD